MWIVPKAMPAPQPPTGITPVESAWQMPRIRLDNQTARKYRVHVSREVDETESSTYTEEGYAEVEAGSPEEARDLVENMLRDGEYMDWEMVGDRSYGDSEITETRDEQIDNIEEV